MSPTAGQHDERTANPLLMSTHAFSPFPRPQETGGRFHRICEDSRLMIQYTPTSLAKYSQYKRSGSVCGRSEYDATTCTSACVRHITSFTRPYLLFRGNSTPNQPQPIPRRRPHICRQRAQVRPGSILGPSQTISVLASCCISYSAGRCRAGKC